LTGGSPAWRNNNPGNIKYSEYARLAGAIGKDDSGFAIFPDYQSGLQGMLNVLTREYGNVTIDRMMKKYAPVFETAKYTAFLKKRVGTAGDKVINDLSLDEFNRLVRAIHTFEGWEPGSATGADTNMGGPGSSVIAQRAGNVAKPFSKEGAPIADLAQTQDVSPAFAATGPTSWPPQYTPPNVLSPDAARRFSSLPHRGPVPYLDEARKSQQALDNWLPPPDGAPRDFADRFGRWDNRSGVSTPVTSGTYVGVRTGDRADLGAGAPRLAQSGDDSFSLMPPLRSGGVAGLKAASYNAPVLNNVPFSNSPPSLASPSQDTIAAMPSFPTGRSLFHALLAARRKHGPNDWTMPLPFYSPAPPTQTVFDSGLPGMLQRAGAFDPPAGGLLGMLQELERNHPDDDIKA
jgi:hypothetical protein